MKGDFLVEAIVAVLVSGIIGTAMAQMYSQIHNVGNMSQGQLVAVSLANEVIDQLRATKFANVQANAGLHTPMVNGVGNGDVLFPRALLQDTGNYLTNNGNSTLDYTGGGDSAVMQGMQNVLHTVDPITGAPTNTINVMITNANLGSNSPSCLITVTVAWMDGTAGGQKVYKTSTMLTQLGLNG